MLNVKINEALRKELDRNCIPYNEGVTTLLVLYFNLQFNNSAMNDQMIMQLSVANLLDYDYEKQMYTFPIELFEEESQSQTNWDKRFPREFLVEYVKLFKNANPERGADTPQVKRKLIELIEKRDNTVTNDEILQAANLHITNTLQQSGPKYVMKADMFISHRDKGYTIMSYIERVREGETAKSKDFNPFEDTL